MQQRPSPVEAMPENWQTALAIAAHPDDLENGASSAVAKWTAQGKHVVYLMVSRGEAGIDSMPPWQTGPLRAEEEIRAARVVGVETVEFLNHTDGVIEQGLPLRRDLSRAIRRHRPDVILTLNHHPKFPTGNPNMADHRNVGLSVFDAARDAGNRWVFQELLSEGLEPWNGVRYVAVFGSPDPTHGIDVTGYLNKGLDSLDAHKAYLEGIGLDVAESTRSRIANLASAGGKALGCEHAELVELVPIN